MRTDSTTLAAVAVEAARQLVASQYGTEYLPDHAARLSDQGQERPGGPRGDSARRPSVRFSRVAPRAAQPRRVQALRPDLEADRRQPDDRRPRPPRHDHHRGRRRGVRGQRQDHRVSRLSAGVRRRLGRSRRPTWPTARWCCRTVAVGETLAVPRHGAEEPHHAAAQSLQRSLAHPGAGGNGHRPAQHLRLDHRHHPRPRVRVQAQARQRAGAHLDGLRRLAVARRATCPTWSTTSSPPRWKTSWTPSAAAR